MKEMDTPTLFQVLQETVFISLCANTIGNDKYSIRLPPDLSKWKGGLFNVDMAAGLGEGKL